jgi:hypothetical protein
MTLRRGTVAATTTAGSAHVTAALLPLPLEPQRSSRCDDYVVEEQ